MASEKVLEAQVGHEVSRRRGKAVGILQPVARQHQRLRLVLPLQALDIEPPQVPFSARDGRRVRVPMLALLARAGGSVGGVILCAISFSRSRRDSPTPSNTWAQASRSFSSAVAAIPEIISLDW